MNRSANATLALVLAAVIATAAARPAMAEPDPIELDRLPNVPVQLWKDANANGSHDLGDILMATTWTDLNGYWSFTGLPTNQTNRLVVVGLPGGFQGMRLGGDLYRFNAFGFAPIDGVPVQLLADTASPTSYYGTNDYQVDWDTTHCVGAYKCGDFRLQGETTVDAQGIVLALSGAPASYSGYRGFLWDATLDDD